MLSSQFFPADDVQKKDSIQQADDAPLLVFLHGFLGSSDDWRETLSYLSEFDRLCLDLPGHGESVGIHTESFSTCCAQITKSVLARLQSEQISLERPIVVVGYSLGARLAMMGTVKRDFAPLNIQALLLEGGNFGLQDEAQRHERWLSDAQWARRFNEEPIEQVLSDWYRQRVFSSLKDAQRQTLIAKRSDNLGPAVAKMLLATSLAKQPDCLDALRQLTLPITYVCGEQDEKFKQLAQRSRLHLCCVENAGHNVHVEQPQRFAEQVRAQCIALAARS